MKLISLSLSTFVNSFPLLKVESYGGNLTVRQGFSGSGPSIEEANLIIIGNEVTLIWTSDEQDGWQPDEEIVSTTPRKLSPLQTILRLRLDGKDECVLSARGKCIALLRSAGRD